MIYPHKRILTGKQTPQANAFYLKHYLKLRKKVDKIAFTKREDFVKFTMAVNKYDKEIAKFESKNAINYQGKLKSSFYEEMCCYLFCKLPKVENGDFEIFNGKSICIGLYFNHNNDLVQKTKNVDFCIGKRINIDVENGGRLSLIKPIIAIEVKTYTDSTMFGEIQNSLSLLRNVSPDASTYVLMGYNSIGKKQFISKNNILIDEMFALRKSEGEEMESEAIEMFYKEISDAVEQYGKNYEVPKCGRLLRPK